MCRGFRYLLTEPFVVQTCVEVRSSLYMLTYIMTLNVVSLTGLGHRFLRDCSKPELPYPPDGFTYRYMLDSLPPMSGDCSFCTRMMMIPTNRTKLICDRKQQFDVMNKCVIIATKTQVDGEWYFNDGVLYNMQLYFSLKCALETHSFSSTLTLRLHGSRLMDPTLQQFRDTFSIRFISEPHCLMLCRVWERRERELGGT